MKILCVCLNPAIQRTIVFDDFLINNVNRAKKFREDASGKGVNSCRVLNQIQKNISSVICPLGKENAERFINLSKNSDLNLIPFLIPGEVRECWTLLDSKNKTTTELIVNSEFQNGSPQDEKDFLSLFEKTLPEFDAVLFSGSKSSFWADSLILKIGKIIKNLQKIFLADFWGPSLIQVLKNSTPEIIKINESEFTGTFSQKKHLSRQELKLSIIEKSVQYKNIFIVTRGKNSTFASDNGIFFEFPSEKIEILNTTACGDSFNSGFLYEFLNSCDLEKSLQKGTECASLNAKSLCPGSIF